MLEELTSQQTYGLVGVAVLLVAVGFGVGTMFGGSTPTGNVAASSGDVSTEEIQQQVQQLMDQQMEAQLQQFQQMAQQSEDISMEDLSMDASVTDVSQSKFDGLYKVTVSIQGQAPSQTGDIQEIDQEQEFYISSDGRYLFQSPTDLEAQPEQPQQPPTGEQ